MASPQRLKRMTPRLTLDEWQVLLDAGNAYEAEPANFEDDPNGKRLNALRRALEKIRKA